jgi:hypothetical protein
MIVRIIIKIIVMCFVGWLLCDIHANESYYWYSGIWHGMFLPVNFVRSLIFNDVLYKAIIYTTAYSVFYWIFGVISVLSVIFGNGE